MYATRWFELFGRPRPGSAIGRVDHRILHHEAGAPLPATATLSQERSRLKAIDAYHRSLGWEGFGYTAMACASGRVHEGRGWFRSGAHTGHMNRTALAVMLPGTNTGMTRAQIAGIRLWDAAGVKAGALTASGRWSGHRDHMARDCPGDRNYRQLRELNAEEEADMPLTNADVERVAAAVWRRNNPTNDRTYGWMVRRLFEGADPQIESVDGHDWSWRYTMQRLWHRTTAIHRTVSQIETVSLSDAELAGIAAELAAAMDDRTAQAVADELSRRLSDR